MKIATLLLFVSVAVALPTVPGKPWSAVDYVLRVPLY